MNREILRELRHHAPFTVCGAMTGIVIMLLFRNIPHSLSYKFFYIFHPMHVVLSALATASMYKLHKCERVSGKCIRGECNFLVLLVIGYAGSIGIATLSDSVIPYLGEVLLGMPDREIHIGFIEKWWLVNPLAIVGVAIAYYRPSTKFPHFGHVLLSTWASLFHMLMATGAPMGWGIYVGIFVFLFFAVWVPCCLSDVAFPLLFIKERSGSREE